MNGYENSLYEELEHKTNYLNRWINDAIDYLDKELKQVSETIIEKNLNDYNKKLLKKIRNLKESIKNKEIDLNLDNYFEEDYKKYAGPQKLNNKKQIKFLYDKIKI